MNILFFLTPKSEVDFIYDNFTLRQTMDRMDHYGYTAVPILDREGRYVGTLSEGDILRLIKRCQDMDLNDLKGVEGIFAVDIPRSRQVQSVHADARMEDLIERACSQNFVPVIDDQGKFIGIITRKDIITYCYQELKTLQAECTRDPEG